MLVANEVNTEKLAYIYCNWPIFFLFQLRLLATCRDNATALVKIQLQIHRWRIQSKRKRDIAEEDLSTGSYGISRGRKQSVFAIHLAVDSKPVLVSASGKTKGLLTPPTAWLLKFNARPGCLKIEKSQRERAKGKTETKVFFLFSFRLALRLCVRSYRRKSWITRLKV